jgi:anti-sigma B factor antagonist
MAAHEFTYPSVPDSEERMLDDVTRLLKRHSLPGEYAHAIILSISEAFTNALEHGNRYDEQKVIRLTIRINGNDLTADIIDQGSGGLDRVKHRRPPTALSEGGRGVDLMSHYAGNLTFAETDDGGLRVTIRFDYSRRQSTRPVIQDRLEELMEIMLREADNVTVLSLRGRLDLATGSALKEEIKELFEKEKNTVHLNLGGVEFVNSSGLGALVSIMKEIRLRKGRLTLSNLATYVQEIFEITQLSHIFEIYETEHEALKSYQTVPVG